MSCKYHQQYAKGKLQHQDDPWHIGHQSRGTKFTLNASSGTHITEVNLFYISSHFSPTPAE